MATGDITVISRKYDQSIRRKWQCRLIEQSGTLVVFVGEFDHEVEHPDLGKIASGTISYEYYWLDRWFNIFRFHDPGGSFRNFYCNMNMPPKFDGKTLDYVDLDIDVVIWPDGRIITLDQDEFDANAATFAYPPAIHEKVRTSLSELRRMIDANEYPFSEI